MIEEDIERIKRELYVDNLQFTSSDDDNWRMQGRPYRPNIVPPSPEFKVQFQQPFNTTGMDYTNALWVKGKGQNPEKAYIILFMYLITRGIHGELVDNQIFDSFLMSFRKFCSRRGFPALMLSDNTTTFVMASEYLKTMSENPRVKEHLLDIKCNRKFIPARATRFGAVWERLIGLRKSCLKKIVGQALLSFEELACALVELEGIINDRPLSYTPRDLKQLEILTPKHLILGRKLKSFPRRVVNWEEISGDLTYGRREFTKKRFLYVSRMCDNLWKRRER
ncbi:uncharacterized protein [Macrobrachium rosenbergii]|uniref:uncharacterized protein n=1 Tax=Macrobrachium rosenbergii TaxID=79674 RepID=UPI0034D6903A